MGRASYQTITQDGHTLSRILQPALINLQYAALLCLGGEIGRRAGFKIRFLHGSVGSIPTPGTTLKVPIYKLFSAITPVGGEELAGRKIFIRIKMLGF